MINRYLKEICEIAGLDDVVYYTRRIRGKVEAMQAPQYDLVTTHTARRSFATNAYLSGGLSREIAMAITGHSKVEDFEKYVKPPRWENAVRAGMTDFFNPQQ